MDIYQLQRLKEFIISAITYVDELMARPLSRTQIIITDIKSNPSHINKKGIKIQGMIMISVKVKYDDYEWQKAYGFLEKDLQKFTLDTFKEKIYKESRVWIREKNLSTEVMSHLNGMVNKTIYLD